ncbi:hypothetical protein AcW1_002639 [Taiwanofungus camphoratus]|nr:hypothetical protein AcV5_009680 [Antrodia cinnamomea]KAI0943487.1 hypothetical protein AcW1_002639 [Antrodia cinnamomea]
MRAICLSLAPILRCQSLTKLESGILLLPPGLEIIFCVALLVKRGCERRHILLVTEGLVYFSLALLDFLVHVITGVGRSLAVFRILDILTGVASFIPLLLYTLHLSLSPTAAEFISTLPLWSQAIARYLLLLFIPAIVAANEVASFVSISYRLFGNTVAVGFLNEGVHVGFDSITLGLLTAFQVAACGIAFYRLHKAFVSRRSVVAAQDEKEVKAHLFHGLGWIAAGLTLGTVETVIGFAQGGFVFAITRRVLRFLGRACLIVGVGNGVDTVEDFTIYGTEVQPHRRSRLLALISNPRSSTFRQVGGFGFDPEAAFGKPNSNRTSTLTPSGMEDIRTISVRFSLRPTPRSSLPQTQHASTSSWTPVSGTFTVASFHADVRGRPPTPPLLSLPPSDAHLRQPQQRVTVHLGNDRPPYLELRRFSDFDLHYVLSHFDGDPFYGPPSIRSRSLPTLALDGFKAAAPSRSFISGASAGSHAGPVPHSFTTNATEGSHANLENLPTKPPVTASTIRPPEYAVAASTSRVNLQQHTSSGDVASSVPSSSREGVSSPGDSIEYIRALASQFPGIPPINSVQAPWLQPVGQVPMPGAPVSRESSKSEHIATGATVRRESSAKRKPVPSFLKAEAMALSQAIPDGSSGTSISQATSSSRRAMENLPVSQSIEVTESPLVRITGYKERAEMDESQAAGYLPTPISMNMPSFSSSRSEPATPSPVQATPRERRARTLSTGKKRRIMGRAPEPVFIDAVADSQDFALPAPRMSIGSAPRRNTPTPTSSVLSRGSIIAEVDEALVDRQSSRSSKASKGSDKGRRRASRKLRKRTITDRRQSGVLEAGRRESETADTSSHSVFED